MKYSKSKSKPAEKKIKHKWIVIWVCSLIIITILIFFTKQDEGFPDRLIGKWTTSEPRYKDRFFELSNVTFSYGLGEDKIDVYFISGIEEKIYKTNTLYTISYYNTDGLKCTRSFYYYPAKGGVIKFKNPRDVEWTKSKDTIFEKHPKIDKITNKVGSNEMTS